jgi:polyhydroxyalkanoate synthesis regulator phasin
VTSGNIQMGPDPDQILTALKRALHANPGMRDRSAQEVSKELVQQGYLGDEADPVLVAEMLEGLQSGKLDLPKDEEDGEETEQASPT